MDKGSFVFRKEWADAISHLPGDVRLEIYEAIIGYGTTGTMEGLRPMAMMALNFARVQIDRDRENYERVSEARSKAASSRWGADPVRMQSAGTQPNADANATNACKSSKCMQKHTKDANATNACNCMDNDNDYDNDIILEREIERERAAHAADRADSDLLEARRYAFTKSLDDYIGVYGDQMVSAFADYWTEPNRSGTKMRFELERTWDTKRRLALWAKREPQFFKNHGNTGNNTVGGGAAERTAAAARDIAGFIERGV